MTHLQSELISVSKNAFMVLVFEKSMVSMYLFVSHFFSSPVFFSRQVSVNLLIKT